MKFILFLITFGFLTSGFASFKKGNGGNAIYCPALQVQWQILDSYEAEAVLGLQPDIDLTANRFDDAIETRLSQIDPGFAKRFNRNFELFLDQARWISNANLGPVNDSFHLVLPVGCTLQQAAIQTDSMYIFENEIWNSLTVIEQKVLQTHELLYRTLREKSDLEDSRPVRALVGLLISREFKSMNHSQIKSFLDQYRIHVK